MGCIYDDGKISQYFTLSLSTFIPDYPNVESKIVVQKVHGNGMALVGIKDGDYLVFDRNLTPADGDIVSATIDGEFMCRRFFMKNGKAYFRREDGITPDTQTDNYEIHAVLVGIWHMGRFSSADYDPDKREMTNRHILSCHIIPSCKNPHTSIRRPGD